jgi:chromosome segregation ATPase
MNLWASLKALITEHGSAAALRDHLALVKEQKAQLESQAIILNAKIKKLEEENAALQTKISELQILLENTGKQVKVLEDFKGKYPQAVQQIRQLQAANQSLEQMLRAKTIGF